VITMLDEDIYENSAQANEYLGYKEVRLNDE